MLPASVSHKSPPHSRAGLQHTLTPSQKLGVSLQAPQSRLDFKDGDTKQPTAPLGPSIPQDAAPRGSSHPPVPPSCQSLQAIPVLSEKHHTPFQCHWGGIHHSGTPMGGCCFGSPKETSSGTHKILLSCPRPHICSAKAAGLFWRVCFFWVSF